MDKTGQTARFPLIGENTAQSHGRELAPGVLVVDGDLGGDRAGVNDQNLHRDLLTGSGSLYALYPVRRGRVNGKETKNDAYCS